MKSNEKSKIVQPTCLTKMLHPREKVVMPPQTGFESGDTTILYKRNLKLIKQVCPDVAHGLKKTRSIGIDLRPFASSAGCPNVMVSINGEPNAMALYDGDDPRQSVRDSLQPMACDPYDTIFLIGLGLGYWPIEAATKFSGRPRLVVIEPYLEILELAAQTIDLSPLLISDRVALMAGEHLDLAQMVAEYQDIIPIGRNRIIVHPRYERLFGESIGRLKNELAERIQTVRDIWYTTKQHGRLMLTNTIANLPSLLFGTPLKSLRNSFTCKPALCISAGPSLDAAIVGLKKIQNSVLLIACDSAVQPLLRAGIKPHIVVTTDIFESNLSKLKPHFEQLRDTILIFGVESNPNCVRLYPGPKRVGVTAYSKLVLHWLDRKLELQCGYPGMSSVSHMALFTALALDAEPIVMVGMDLAYAEGKSHSAGSSFCHCVENEKIAAVQSNQGGLVDSSPQFVADRLLIETIIAQSKKRFINTSIQGAYVKGAYIQTLNEVTHHYTQGDTGVHGILDCVDWHSAADEIHARSVMADLLDEFSSFHCECRNVRQIVNCELEKIVIDPAAERGESRLIKIMDQATQFISQNQAFMAMVKEIMLSEFQENFKQKEVLSGGYADQTNLQIHLKKGACALADLEILENGMTYLLSHLQQAFGCLGGPAAEVADNTEVGLLRGAQFVMAQHFENCDQLWRADLAYQTCIRLNPGKVESYAAWARAYLKHGLLTCAKTIVDGGFQKFGRCPELHVVDHDIAHAIDQLMEMIRQAWMSGDMTKTRKLLHEYQRLRSEDVQAQSLNTVIEELEQKISSEFVQSSRQSRKKSSPKERYSKATAKIITLDFESAIGIFEGLIAEFPQGHASLREKIGDCRMSQKEYRSADWNYQQALTSNPNRTELITKLAAAEHLHGHDSR